jgi:hypothetical protein
MIEVTVYEKFKNPVLQRHATLIRTDLNWLARNLDARPNEEIEDMLRDIAVRLEKLTVAIAEGTI